MDKIHEPARKNDSYGISQANSNEADTEVESLAPPPLQFVTNHKSEEEDDKTVDSESTFQLAFSDDASDETPSDNSGSSQNNTGLPTQLKSGVEQLSGFSLDDVKVHYNSSKPGQLQAHAYAQGSDIHLGPGQEKHLPHEAWHVVQQKQGRVQPTAQLKAFNINDDAGLEREADVMGEKAQKTVIDSNANKQLKAKSNASTTFQLVAQNDIVKRSKNGLYMTTEDDKVLYSKAKADPPQPKALYESSQEILQGVNKNTKILKWTPNVKLFPTSEIEAVFGKDEDEGDDINIERSIEIYTAKKAEIEKALSKEVRIGILSENDCQRFATFMRYLIGQQKESYFKKRSKKNIVSPGTQITREYGSPWLNSNHHSITVVASDEESIVSLEAHAGKQIHEPQFNIYDSIQAFEEQETPPDDIYPDPTSKNLRTDVEDRAQFGPEKLKEALDNFERSPEKFYAAVTSISATYK